MKFLICPVPEQFLNFDSGYFCHPVTGDEFYYEVEFNEDEDVIISDTMGRSIPIGLGELESLIDTLTRIKDFTEGKAEAQHRLTNSLNYITQDLTRGTTCY